MLLWSLIKILLFVAIIAALTFGAMYLIELEGGVRVTFGGVELTYGPLETVIAGVLLLVAVWLLLKILSFSLAVLRFLSGDETALSRFFARNAERRGYRALAEGLTALASGEGKLAMSKAERAERYLQRPDLTNLLIAQAAEMNGDTAKATETYKKLISDEKTRFVGVRGIMKQKLIDGDVDTALKLAETAFKIKPRHEEVQDVLLKLQAEAKDWTGARNTLAAKLKHGSLPRDVFTRRQAVLALGEAKDLIDSESTIEERERAIEANRLSPDLIPAAAMAARGYIDQNKPRYATRILKKAWTVQPHPDLAAAFAAIAPDESPAERLKRFSTLTNINADNSETKMLLAELNIAAEDFPAARRAMGDLAESDPTKRSLTLMAAIERGEGSDDTIVKAWLAKALTASSGPQWICEATGRAYPQWVPYTEGGFDTLTWKRADSDADGLTDNAQGMLPLIVGAIADKSDETAEDDSADADVIVAAAEVDGTDNKPTDTAQK